MYYHGRGNSRPYYGNQIFITNNLNYASIYTNLGYVFEIELNFSSDKIFSLRNIAHRDLIIQTFGQEILNHIDTSSEIDWSQIGYLCNDQFDSGEDWMISLGFKAVKLKERSNIDSICVFNHDDVTLSNKITI